MGNKQRSELSRNINNLLTDTNPISRWTAAIALASAKDNESFDALLKALKDDDNNVREFVAGALAERGDPRAVLPLIHALQQEQNKSCSGMFAKALGRLGDRRAVLPLIHALGQEKDDEWCSTMFAEALGRLGDPQAILAVISSFSHVDDSFLRSGIQEVLVQFGDVSIEPLVAALQDPDERIRTGSVATLAHLGPKTTQPLLKALTSQNPEVRTRAAAALGKLGNAAVVDPLLARLQDDDPDVVQAATRALGRIGDARTRDPLLGVLKSRQVPIQVAAVEALGELRDPGAIDELIVLLGDPLLGMAAEQSIVKYGEVAVRLVIAKFWDDRDDVRDSATRVLARMGREFLRTTVETLHATDWRVRHASTVTIGRFWLESERNHGEPPDDIPPIDIAVAVDSLVTVVDDGDARVREAAMVSLGTVGAVVVACGERERYRDPTNQASVFGLYADRAFDALIAGLSDSSFRVSASAATALGTLGSGSSAEHLFVVLERPGDLARRAAADALMKIPDEQGVDSFSARSSTPIPRCGSSLHQASCAIYVPTMRDAGLMCADGSGRRRITQAYTLIRPSLTTSRHS